MSPPSDIGVSDRLRATADEVSRQVGDQWRRQAAAEMGVAPAVVGMGPVGKTRDSGTLDRSNFRVVLAALREADDRVHAHRFRHWARGWVEELAVPLDNPALLDRITHWAGQLEAYPVADDDTDLAALDAEELDAG